MKLLSRSPNGRLDSLAACMLLWSGALTFGQGCLSWDGHTHQIGEPTINDGVISLYAVPRSQVTGALPDLMDLLRELEADDLLRVPNEAIAEPVRDALPCGHLTGAALFLLQGDLHPLIVEAGTTSDLRVRYHEKLSRGIPHLQDLLCRMLMHVRAFRGERGTFSVEFMESSALGRPCGIDDFEGHVDGSDGILESSVTVEDALGASSFDCVATDKPIEKAPVGAQANKSSDTAPSGALPNNSDGAPTSDVLADKFGTVHPQPPAHATAPVGSSATPTTHPATHSPEAQYLRAMSQLEAHAYTTRELLALAKARLAFLEQERERLEQAKPDPNAKEYQVAADPSFGMPSPGKAMRTLGFWSVFYLMLGIVLFILGRSLAFRNERIAQQLMVPIRGALDIVSDGLSIVLGNGSLAGQHNILKVASGPLASALRVGGMLLMALAIILPVRKIIKHKRQIDRELSFTKTHGSFIAELAAKQRLYAEEAYAQTLAAWSANLQEVTEGIADANKSCHLLESTQRKLDSAREECYDAGPLPTNARDLATTCTLVDYLDSGAARIIAGPGDAFERYREDLAASRVSAAPQHPTSLQPTLRSSMRACDRLLRGIKAEKHEGHRRERIAEHCTDVSAAIAAARSATDALGRSQI